LQGSARNERWLIFEKTVKRLLQKGREIKKGEIRWNPKCDKGGLKGGKSVIAKSVRFHAKAFGVGGGTYRVRGQDSRKKERVWWSPLRGDEVGGKNLD